MQGKGARRKDCTMSKIRDIKVFKPEDIVVLTVSGRGDKDIETYLQRIKK